MITESNMKNGYGKEVDNKEGIGKLPEALRLKG
jgi:hypothetical protein